MNESFQAVSKEETDPTERSGGGPERSTVNRSSNSRTWLALKANPTTLGAVTAGVLLMVAIAIALPRLWTARPPERQSTATALPVQTLRLKAVQSYKVTRSYTGQVTATRTSEIGFERSGTLIWVGVDRGDRVQAGDAIAQLDVQNLQAQLQQLRAQTAQAEAVLQELRNGPRSEVIAAAQSEVNDLQNQLALQDLRRDRRQTLYQEGAISREQLDEVAFNRNSVQARLRAAQSQLAELENGTRSEQLAAQTAVVQRLNASITDLEITIAKSTIRAPFAGVISERRLDEGGVVNAGQAIVRLVEGSTPEVEVGVPVDVAAQLRAGSLQTVQIGEKRLGARVRTVKPEVNPTTRTRTVVLTLQLNAQTPLLQIPPDQVARLEVTQTIATQGFWLPITALTRSERGLWSCFALVNQRVERRDVEVLHTESDRVLVRGLLEAGDRVITTGIQRLVPGQTVRD